MRHENLAGSPGGKEGLNRKYNQYLRGGSGTMNVGTVSIKPGDLTRNRKLAEKIGWIKITSGTLGNKYYLQGINPKTHRIDWIPDLSGSDDAAVEWLLPWLSNSLAKNESLMIEFSEWNCSIWVRRLADTCHRMLATDKLTLHDALASAVEAVPERGEK